MATLRSDFDTSWKEVLSEFFEVLPERLEQEFMRELKRYEEEEAMPVLTQFEKIAMRKGRREGLKEGQAEILAHQLERKFGRLDETTRERVQSARPGDILGWADRVLTAERLEDVFA